MPHYKVKIVNGQKTLVDYSKPHILQADEIGYDNTTSGMSATDTQEAIDELKASKVSKSGDIMTGPLTFQRANPTMNFIDMDGSTERRKIFIGNANSGGDFYIYDNTNSKAILLSSADGTNVQINGLRIDTTKYSAGSVPDNAYSATNGSLKNVYDMLNMAKGTYTGSLNNVGSGSSVLKPNSCVWINTTTTNKPTGVSYGVVCTFYVSSSIILQVVYSISGQIYWREYYDSGAGAAWHPWHSSASPLAISNNNKSVQYDVTYQQNASMDKTFTAVTDEAYFKVQIGASNNSTVTLLQCTVYVNGVVVHNIRQLNTPYAMTSWISPLIARGSTVRVVGEVQASSYNSSTKSQFLVEKYFPD